MKKISGLILLLAAQIGYANPPVFSLVPGVVPHPIWPAQSVSATYIVTNTTPYLLVGNGLRYAPVGLTPLTVIQNTSPVNTPPTCTDPFTLAAGASCTLDLTITSPVTTGPEVCNLKNYPTHCSIPAAGLELNVPVSPGMGVAVGGYVNTDEFTFLVQSYDLGDTWDFIDLAHTASRGLLEYVACNIDLCVAPGFSSVSPHPNYGFLVYSADGGQTWTQPAITFGDVNGAACTQSSAGMCFVWAYNATSSSHFTSIQYTAATHTWNPVNLLATTSSNFQGSPGCGSNFCVAGGQTNGAPFLFAIQNPGSVSSNWTRVSTFVNGPLPAASVLTAAGCDGVLCVYFGQNTSTNVSYTVRTSDSGNTWTYYDLTSPSIKVDVSSVSCNEASHICAALGKDNTGSAHLLKSTDAGISWTDVTPISFSLTNGQVSCSQALCVLAANDSLAGVSYVYQSISGGPWDPVTISGVSSSDTMTSVKCTDQYCLVGGRYGSIHGALLAQTQDGGSSWAAYNLSQIPSFPANSSFKAVNAVIP